MKNYKFLALNCRDRRPRLSAYKFIRVVREADPYNNILCKKEGKTPYGMFCLPLFLTPNSSFLIINIFSFLSMYNFNSPYANSFESSIIVTGPSFNMLTFISAPNSPVSTFSPVVSLIYFINSS